MGGLLISAFRGAQNSATPQNFCANSATPSKKSDSPTKNEKNKYGINCL